MISRLRWILAGGLILSLMLRPPGGKEKGAAQAADGRLVLAFYYAWYDRKTWTSGQTPDTPLVPYASADRETMARHIAQAQRAGIDAFVLNWWGKGNQTEKNLIALLELAAQKGFRVAVDFDINSPFMHGAGDYADNLRHVLQVHAARPAYLRYRGRPVIFFYNVARLPLSTWQSIRAQVDPNHNALWIAEGVDLKYQAIFDGHHLYSIAWPNKIPPSQTLPKWGNRLRRYNRRHGTDKLWVATVMPGYDDRRVRPANGFVQPRQGGDYYRRCWQAAIASRPHWVVINSFNEWPEGTYIEPSQSYGDLYLTLTSEWAARFKGSALASPTAIEPTATPHLPTPTPSPTPTPLPPPPTPRPPLHLLNDGWFRLQQGQGRRCGYTILDLGVLSSWIPYCDSETAAADLFLAH